MLSVCLLFAKQLFIIIIIIIIIFGVREGEEGG